ncbi:hypothetical protein Bca4012_094838 [Brassica carinata]
MQRQINFTGDAAAEGFIRGAAAESFTGGAATKSFTREATAESFTRDALQRASLKTRGKKKVIGDTETVSFIGDVAVESFTGDASAENLRVEYLSDTACEPPNHLRGQLKRLYGRKFVVGNVARIGCLPYQRSTNQLKDKQCVDLTNKLTLQYNARLKDLLLVELKDSLKDVHFVYASVYHGPHCQLQRIWVMNFSLTAREACCGTEGRLAGILPCGPTSCLCKDRSKLVVLGPVPA